MDWLVTLLVVAAVAAVALTAYLVARVALSSNPSRERSAASCAEALRSGGSSVEQSRGFTGLLSLGVVSIHTIVNKGQSYRDEKQSDAFKAGLTPERVLALKHVKGAGR